MSPAEIAAVRAYLAPNAPTFWQWEEDRSAITWLHGPTITLRQELAIVLSSPMNCTLPPLTAVLILLSACRDSWLDSRSRLANIMHAYESIEGVKRPWFAQLLDSLDRIHAASRTHLHSPQRKAALVNYLFPDRTADASLAANMSKLLAAMGPVAQLDDLRLVQCDFWLILGTLNRALQDVDPHVFDAWFKTGLTQEVQPAEVELPAGERVRSLLQQLNDHPEFGGVARLARQLLAAITLPRPLAEPDDLPLGGVSDITNRGALDRLLLSELAHDDLTLAVRVAMNEALYYRRETPPRSPPLRRTIVLDSGLRTWGVPRLFTTAVGLALSAAGDEQLSIDTFRASEERLVSVDLTRQTGLAEHLAALETDLHLGRSLPALERARQAQDLPSDLVLITTDDALADEEFRQLLRGSELHGSWIATINREGRFRLLEFGRREMVLKREATFDLKTILTPNKRPAPPLYSGDKSLPAFCRLLPGPLRIPHEVDAEKAWSIGNEGALALYKDGRLTWWQDPKRPPQILHEQMAPRGKLQWADSLGTQQPFRAVIGSFSLRGLRAVQVWPHDGRVAQATLVHNYAEQFTTVWANAEQIFLIGPKRVVCFAWTGEELATSTSFTQHINGRYFRCGGPRFIGAIHCEGNRIGLTAGYSLPGNIYPSVIAVIGSAEAPYAIVREGLICQLLNKSAERLFPVGENRTLSVSGISRDGLRALVRSQAQTAYVVSVDPVACKEVYSYASPLHVLDPKLTPFLARQANLRQHFRGIYVTSRGELALASKKGEELTLKFSPQLVLQSTGRSQVRQPALRPFVKTETSTGYSLERARWDDGSEAWLDSRGLLHLRSSSSNVPEITVVLHEGHTTAWNSNGYTCGNPFFAADDVLNAQASDLAPLVRRFLSCLVTVEST